MRRRRNPSLSSSMGSMRRRTACSTTVKLTQSVLLLAALIGIVQDNFLSHCVRPSSAIFVHSFSYPTSIRICSTSIILKLRQKSKSNHEITSINSQLVQCTNGRIRRITPKSYNEQNYSSCEFQLFASRASAQNENENTIIQQFSKQIQPNEENYAQQQSARDANDEISLMEVDARHNSRTALVYDPTIERYVDRSQNENIQSYDDSNGGTSTTKLKLKVVKTISNAFLPEGVTESYYKYIKWRIIQRFINANVHVFGTQSLLMGLGKQNRRVATAGASALGLSAVFNWVLKDALGKIVRMIWASRMGRKFDPDAKRWRFRSSLLFAIGNGLEVMTYVYPSLFLLLATMANACKQMGMLTSSATRNALYNSFRDGTRENIGDITAKGEAQIAIVDLMGIVSGVCLSRAIGTSVKAVFSVWVLLQVFEVFCVYKEIRAVVFKMLNFERLWQVVNKFIENFNERDFLNGSAQAIPLPTPNTIANNEKIFFPPNHLARRAISFGSLSRAKLSPDELTELINIFKNEKYILVVGQDLKNRRIKWDFAGFKKEDRNSLLLNQMKIEAQENCHIVLHADAKNLDIVKSTLALAILRRKLAKSVDELRKDNTFKLANGSVNGFKSNDMDIEELANFVKTRRSRDSFDLLQESREETDRLFGSFLKVLLAKGWATPARFMFGRVSMRTEWPIKKQ